MRLGLRTMVAVLLVGTAPLVLAGYSALRLADEALTRRVSDLHVTVARLLADRIADEVRRDVLAVSLAATATEIDRIGRPAHRRALDRIFRQVDRASAVVLLGEDGEPLTRVVHLTAASDEAILAGRPGLSPADVDAFLAGVPFAAAWEQGAAVGVPYVAPDGSGPRLVIAVRPDGSPLVLAVEIDQRHLMATIGRTRLGHRGRAFVVDAQGRVVLDAAPGPAGVRADPESWGPVWRAVVGARDPVPYDDPILGEAVGAGVSIPELGWAVIAAEPLADATAASRALRRRLGVWLLAAFAAAAVLGLVSTRTILRPIRAVSRGASAVAEGDLSHRVAGVERTDEIGELARAFNEMATEVERSNRELESRVAAQHRELREAQALLLRSQKLAAVGQLGAGVAHEVNNPLAAILGLAQLLALEASPKSQSRERLDQIQEMARRIQEIVGNLQRLAEFDSGIHLQETDLLQVVDSAVGCVSGEFGDEGIEIVHDHAPGLPPVAADASRLTEALLHLLQNARNAMPGGGTITLSTRLEDGSVALTIADTGEGISLDLQARIFDPFFTTKRRDWQAKGLGLALVNKIVEGHKGTVTVSSRPGEGAAFTITLPAARARSVA